MPAPKTNTSTTEEQNDMPNNKIVTNQSMENNSMKNNETDVTPTKTANWMQTVLKVIKPIVFKIFIRELITRLWESGLF